MDNVLSIANVVVTSMIPFLVACNWRRFDALACLERLGQSIMAISCACIVMKAGYYLSMQEFRSDMFGIIFRLGYLFYLAGNLYRNPLPQYRQGCVQSLRAKSQRSQ